MQKVWTPPRRWVFLAATLLGLFSTLQAYRLTSLAAYPEGAKFFPLLVLNLAFWYVPAAFVPTIFRLAQRFHVGSRHWPRSVGIHCGCAVLLALMHAGCMIGVRSVLWPDAGKMANVAWSTFAQRLFLINLDWLLATYWAVLGLSYALSYNREAQQRQIREAHLEARLVEARLRTLEAELHPHFLFNTLHAISTLVHSDGDAADRMISRLSDLLRLTFDRSGAPGIPLHEELEFLQKYLEIEQIRFQDRLAVRFEIDPETLDAEVPRLILQPLVENAIKHGVSPRAGQGLVQVAAQRRGERLWLEVRDNGVGLTAGARARLDSGVGLSNTRDRLECLYGEAHRLEFSDGTNGLAVRVEIPFHRTAPAAEAAFRVA
ncbi:MAG TPA: sensor histidine kinase [Vicinamibacterales bacterium]|nr:sensor histidine kinase [Vicinamibacterales bacterium]